MCKKLIYLTSFILVLGLALPSVVEARDPDLVGWWKLDDGSGTVAVDSSGNGRDGTLEGDPQWVTGVLGGALQFDGDGDAVDLGSDDVFNFPGSFSISVWVNYAAWNSGWQNVIVGKHGEGNSWQLRRHNGNDNLTFTIRGTSGADDPQGTIVPTFGEWYHVVAIYDADAGTRSVYINNVLDVQIDDTGTHNTDDARVYIGARNNGNSATDGPTGFIEGMIDDVYIFSRALTVEEIPLISLGLSPEKASKPIPEDEAIDVLRDAVLSWDVGEFANTHDVYLGTVFDDVSDADRSDPRGVLANEDQSATTYDPPGRLDFGQTYYWRIDEVNAPPDSTIFKGRIWSFRTELFAYPIENITVTASSEADNQLAENTVNGSGLENDQHSTELEEMWLSDGAGPQPTWIQFEFDKAYKLYEMWVWNHNGLMEAMLGLGFKDVSIEYSVNGTDYTTLGTTHEFAQAPGSTDYEHNTTVDFGGAAAKYVRLTVNSSWVVFLPQYGLSEVRFFYIPVHATEPSPDSGATDVAIDVTLGFRAGREAGEHDVYLSTDEQAVIDGTAPVNTVTENSYSTTVDLASTYYWRVDEVNNTPAAPVPAYDQNFDSLAVGTNLQSVDGWEGWFGDETVAGLVTADQAYSGNNSMESVKPVDACPNWDRITSGTWTLTTMQYVPSTVTSGDTYYGVLSGYIQEPLAWITEVVSDFAAGDVRITGGDTVRLPLVRDAWAEIRVELDFDSNVSNFYYNGELLGTRDAVGLEGFDLWANSDDVIYYDDFLLVPAATPGGTTYQGDIWNFSTQEFRVVDDFELYNDLNPDDPESNRIFNTWIDGLANPATNGSIVGYDVAPFAEQGIVSGGKQSMPFSYDNTTAGNSEATANIADLQVDQDWTKGGAETLVLWIHGALSNAAADQLYLKINDTKVMYGGDLSEPIWKQWNIDLASLGINLSSITTVSIGVDGSGPGMLYVDDIALYRIAQPVVEPTPGSDRSLVAHWKLDETSGLTAADSSGYGNDGTLIGMTGDEWTVGILDGALMLDGSGQYVDFGNPKHLQLSEEVTISAWVKMEPGNEDAYMGIAGKMGGFTGANRGFVLVRHSSNVFRLWVVTDGGFNGATSDVTYNDTDWHHLVGVASNATGSLYVDGVKQAIEAEGELQDSGDYAFIGRQYDEGSDDRLWNGIVDDVRIYYRALSEQEILGL